MSERLIKAVEKETAQPDDGELREATVEAAAELVVLSRRLRQAAERYTIRQGLKREPRHD